MISTLFTIKDVKTSAFRQIFMFEHKNAAIRAFRTSVNDEGTEMALYPSDFELYSIGEFNKTNGDLKAYPPQFIISGMELKNEKDHN